VPATSSASAEAEDIAPAATSASAEAHDIPSCLKDVESVSNHNQIKNQRKRAQESLIHQAERMVKRSRIQHAPG
jgi:hypothetical protein